MNISLYQNTDHGVSNGPMFWQKRPQTQLLLVTFHFLMEFYESSLERQGNLPKITFSAPMK